MPSLKKPTDLVVIPAEWLRDTLDAAVRRGRMTRDDATELLAELLRGRRPDEPAADAFPLEDYDELTAAQVGERVKELQPDELRRVRDYERRNANRKTVLSALDQRLKP
jgi:polyhydroxyalkanoate synthesis regulator phasin